MLTLLSLICIAAPADIPAPLRALADEMRAIQSLEVKMRQVKVMSVFGDEIESKGVLVFARPRKLLMDLDGPGGTTLIVNGDLMTMHFKALKKTDRMNLSKDPRARAIAEHLFLLLEANPEALSEVYDVELTGTAPLRVELVPKAAALRKFIARVTGRFDARGFVTRLEVHEANGDSTRWSFSSPKINRPIPDSRFEL